MKILLDFLVLILFFGTYYFTKDIFTATEVAIVGGVIQAIVGWVQNGKLDGLQMLNLFIILVFGGSTLLFHDDSWIKWKPTVLYWTFAIILSGGLMIHRNFVQELLEKEIKLPEVIWRRLAISWVTFFGLLGVLNLWVAFSFSLDQWVTFKVFGAIGLLLLFTITQGIYIRLFLLKRDSDTKDDNRRK